MRKFVSLLFSNQNSRADLPVYAPDCVHLLLARGLGLANKQVPRLVCATGDLQELVELEHPAFAAGPPLTALVEDRLARVVDALLLITSSRPGIGSTATPPTACCVGRNLHFRIIRLGLLDDWLLGRCRSSDSWGSGDW